MATTLTNPPIQRETGAASTRPSARIWIYTPALDLLVGCGAWSAPLLLITALVSGGKTAQWSFAFYLLALLFNYPHFMATAYRAYRSYDEVTRYRFYTIHVALLLAAAGLLAHLWYPVLPWIFTLYICWSPWHYTGQNFGLAMMFARRAELSPSENERRLLHLSFIASYLMLLLSFQTGPSGDSMIISLGLPAVVTLPARLMLAIFFVGASALALYSVGAPRRLEGHVANRHTGDHAVPVVPAAGDHRVGERERGAADPLFQRHSGGAAFGAISLDHQLLPA